MPSPKSPKAEAGVRLQRKGSSLRRRGRSGGGSGDVAAWAAAAEGPLLVDQPPETRYRSFRVRFVSSIVLIVSFLTLIWAGHVPLMFMVLGIQTLMVKELFTLARHAQAERKLPGFRAQQWFFFMVAAFWVYIRFIKNNLIVEITSSARLARMFGWLLKRHTMLSFYLYTAGFVSFVLTLKKGRYTYQFGQYAWTHMILLVVFLPSSLYVSLLFEGIIWFLLPTALVIVNDIMAYLAGFFFGRTPLIKLSPKKTWEGFLGGCVGTVVAAWYGAWVMSQFKWFTCPRMDLSIWQPMPCDEVPDIYRPHTFRLSDALTGANPAWVDLVHNVSGLLPPRLRGAIAGYTFTCLPMQLHAVSLALFASFIAPFGGFFASGFKRGFKIKDFGDSIPGHGGVTDRFDCQVVMAIFCYVYFNNYVSAATTSVSAVMSAALKLPPLQQLELLERLSNVLVSQDLLAVLRGSNTCPTEQALMKRQEARLADPATDYDFSAGGQQATYLDGLRREALAALAPHVAPANLRFKQLSGNRRMVIPFGQRGSTVYAVDVAALDPQAVHEAASKVGMPKDCPASGCGCIRLALLNQLVETVAEQRMLPRSELQSAVMGRVLEANGLAGQPPPPPPPPAPKAVAKQQGQEGQPQLQQRQTQARAQQEGRKPSLFDLIQHDDDEALQPLPRPAGGPLPGVGADEEGQRIYSRLKASVASGHLEGTSECHRSGRHAPPQAEPPMCSGNLGAAFEAGSYLYAPFSRAHPSAKPQFANLPTERQMVMVRRLHVLLTRIMHGAFGFPPRFYIYWHPHDAALAFNQGGAIWYNAGHRACSEFYRQGTLAWANRYYLLACHELTHNYVHGHGVEFSDWMAKIAMRFCVAYERLRNAKGRGSLWEAIDAVSL